MIEICRYFSPRDIAECALVLQAMRVEHEIQRGVVGWRIVVPPEEANRAREQLRLYREENRPRPPPDPLTAPRPGAAAGVFAWALVLMWFALLQTGNGFGFDWLTAGRIDGAAIRAGEWWRAATALTLHVDMAHLLGNIGFGAVFMALLAREIGGGFASLLILTGGIAGNLCNAAIQPPAHLSIGASTAVFAALGILAAYLWTGKRLIRDTWARRLSPVVGGIILLAWLGTGTERTDIVAHLTGFLSGFAIGVVLGRLDLQALADVRRQWLFGGAALGLLAAAWSLALSARLQ